MIESATDTTGARLKVTRMGMEWRRLRIGADEDSVIGYLCVLLDKDDSGTIAQIGSDVYIGYM